MRKYAACLCCIFLLTLLTQAGNAQPAKVTALDLTRIQKKAEQGDAKAQYELGWIYFVGESIPQDYAKAAQWSQKAAEQGNRDGQFLWGYLHLLPGQAVPEDTSKAAQWFQKAAKQGHPLAQFQLAWAHYIGRGVAQDKYEAAKWFKKAAEQGNAGAQYYLGMMYLHRSPSLPSGISGAGSGVIHDRQKGCRLIRDAAEQGDREAIETYNKLCAN